MKLISENVNEIIRKIFNRQHPLLAEILINWNKIVGDKFSLKTSPVKISRSKEKGENINILLVEVENSSISVEFSFQQEIIMERIAIYLGYRAVNKIRVIVRG